WTYLCAQMSADLATGAPAALGKLEAIRAAFQVQSNARVVEVGSSTHQAAIAADVGAFVRAIPQPPQVGNFTDVKLDGWIATRLAGRDKSIKLPLTGPTFVGLVAPSTSSGVFENLSHSKGYADTSDDALLDYLAASLYTGHGAHSMFMKTWAAGLAYSNGLHPNVDAGTLDYYAERCPLLPQTLRFVIDELSRVTPDANIARYAIANAFDSRVAASYEGRAAAMAADLADGISPELVKTFRSKILAIAKRPDLADVLFKRMRDVYARVLPGFGPLDPAATYFVIGPDKQLDAYAQYLAANVSKSTKLHRLYPRDFWVIRP
ncbi:MAG: hypothetical protein NT062_11740, partial [Proteobacteria bacterium]|nr:hypothetical protein [Pseudomonadota bacterium]